MARFFLIDVECRCGQVLFRYAERGRSRLIKCFLDEIDRDEVDVVEALVGIRPQCPRSGKEIGIVRIVRGRPALKLNQGAVQKVVI